jgi:Glycosyltransferase family 10 (fucosyltransferase) C-term
MTQKIVGMLSSYKNLDYRDWLWPQTPHPFGVWGNMQMLANTEKPDTLLLYNFNEFPAASPPAIGFWSQIKPSQRQRLKLQQQRDAEVLKRLQQVPQERIVFLVREPPFPEKQAERMAQYQQAAKYCGYVSGPDDLAPIPEYMPAIWYYGGSFRELNEMGPPEKTRRCSWITSGISRTENHRKRLAFLRMLVESDLEWSGGGGELKNKAYAIAPYYYNLAIENYADNDWYVSEKLWDSLLGWCLPIYYGGSAADKLLPPGSFLRLPSQDEKGLAYIQEVTSTLDAWHEAKDAIAEARQIILHKLNLLAWLSDFVAKTS